MLTILRLGDNYILDLCQRARDEERQKASQNKNKK